MRLFAPSARPVEQTAAPAATVSAAAPTGDDTPTAPAPEAGGTLRRRGLIAGAAALAAATLAAQPVNALGPLVGTGTGYTGGMDTNADGVQGYAKDPGNAGVFGRNNDLNGMGVSGAAPSGIGVSGASGSGPGVSGVSASGHGTVGLSTSGFGVYAQSDTGKGVYAVGTGAGSVAFQGYTQDPASYAAYLGGRVHVGGMHTVAPPNGSGYGLYDYGNTAGYGGVWGIASVNGAVGVVGQAAGGITNAYAGYFLGNVTVQGNFGVTGTKNAIVPHPDGNRRVLHCMETPEAWFEDVGSGSLAAGSAAITLDPDFAALVVTGAYYVFLTPGGDCKGLYVTAKTATGFAVRKLGGGTSGVSFSYRVVARRKDVAATRLARFTPPSLGPAPAPPPPFAVPPGLPQPAAPPMAPAPVPVSLPTAPALPLEGQHRGCTLGRSETD